MRTMMMMAAGAAAAAMLAPPATAKDSEPCGKDLVCASAPTTVAAELMRAGYQALIAVDGQGDPKVESAAQGYKFGVYFYGCEDHKACDSLQFQTAITPDKRRDIAFANKWNATKRFSQMVVEEDGTIRLSYDVATIGGLTRRNFADVVDWWTSLVGQYDKFATDNPPAVTGKSG